MWIVVVVIIVTIIIVLTSAGTYQISTTVCICRIQLFRWKERNVLRWSNDHINIV